MTFSIVAFEPEGPMWGVAVASKALCVGAHVPWGGGGLGALATQAWHDLRYGWEGLALLQRGLAAQEVVDVLTRDDPEAAVRQVGVVDARGRSATHTGPDCMSWAGGLVGDGWAAQGNLLAGPQVVEAMAAAYTGVAGQTLARRLVTALLAGDEAGGDRRGRQSAALRIWRVPDPDQPDRLDVAADLRVDDHRLPVHELDRLLSLPT